MIQTWYEKIKKALKNEFGFNVSVIVKETHFLSYTWRQIID